jgi:hypothetical protein
MNFLNQGITSSMLRSKVENKENQILKTYDYEIFKRMKGNRVVNNSHVKNLVKSMQEKYLPQPLTVNEDMEIIDGQHRFAAAMELNLPIYYQIINGTTISDVQRLNTNTKNWGNPNYLNMFYERESKDYVIFKEFMDEYELPLETTMSLLLDIPSIRINVRNDFKNGNFKIKDLSLARKHADMMLQLKPYYQGWNRRAFGRALLLLFHFEGYNHSVLIKKLQYCSHMLQHKINSSAYLATIEEIYNFNSKTDYIYLTRRK